MQHICSDSIDQRSAGRRKRPTLEGRKFIGSDSFEGEDAIARHKAMQKCRIWMQDGVVEGKNERLAGQIKRINTERKKRNGTRLDFIMMT